MAIRRAKKTLGDPCSCKVPESTIANNESIDRVEFNSDSNAGSRARDHLANERTFLAWVRTALGGLALGVALERFDSGEAGTDSTVLALLILGASVVALAAATLRYFRVARGLDQGQFVVDRHGPLYTLIAAVLVALVAMFVVL